MSGGVRGGVRGAGSAALMQECNNVFTLHAASGAVVRPEKTEDGAAEKNGVMRAKRSAVGAAVVSCKRTCTFVRRRYGSKTRDQTQEEK